MGLSPATDLRSLIDLLDRLGRAYPSGPGAQALALWQVAALELRDRLRAVEASPPGSARALDELADLERVAAGLAREAQAGESELPAGLDLGPLREALARAVEGLGALRARHLKLAGKAPSGENGPKSAPRRSG